MFPRAGLLFLLLHGFLTCLGDPHPSLTFVQNKNQWHCSVDYATHVPGGTLAVSAGQFSFILLDVDKIEERHHHSHLGFEEVKSSSAGAQVNGHVIKSKLLGANTDAVALPFGQLDEYYNFFIGTDEKKWSSGALAYQGIIYQSIYSGTDLKIYSQGNNLKYDFIVAPGSDPSLIRWRYDGVDELNFDQKDIEIKSSVGSLIEKKPVAYQWINGKKISITCEYTRSGNEFSFRFPQGFDSCYELVIDPLLIFSTYSGSKADNWGSTATPGEQGKLYSAGVTNRFVGNQLSGDFPVTAGAFQTTYGGLYDVGILKYDSTGSQLLYASYLGGSGNESAHSLVMNASGDLIVLGTTGSGNFPTTTGAIDKTYNGGTADANVIDYTGSDIFVARISSDGKTLMASTYLGGSKNDGLNPHTSALTVNYGDELRGDVITDSNNNIYISSVTSSSDFPVTSGFNSIYKGGATDALIMKLNPSLNTIMWSAFLGGNGSDASYTIKFDKAGNLFVAGGTASTNFPVTFGAHRTTFGGTVDGWVANLASDGTSILSCTYLGTPSFDQVYIIDLNQNDDLYVYGQTASSVFPVTAGTYNNPKSGQFIQKFSHALTQLIFSTVVGSGRGLPDISPTAFLVNDCNHIFLTGWGGGVNQNFGKWNNNTVGMPVTSDAFQKTTSGSDFYFMVLRDDATQFLYGTYMGGSTSLTHVDGGTSRFDKKGVVYHAVCSGCRTSASSPSSSDFPTTASAWSKKNNSLNCNNAAFKFDLSSLRARIESNAVVCLPDKIVFRNKSTGGQVYKWDFGDNTSIEAIDTAAIAHQYTAPGKYLVKLKALDNGTCIGKDSTQMLVNVYVPLGEAKPGEKICYNSSFQLRATGGVVYQWQAIGSDFKSNGANPIVSPTEDTQYKVAITDYQGCVVRDTIEVKVVPNVDLQFDMQRIFNCNDRPVLSVTNTTDESEETFWDFGDGSTSLSKNETHTFQQDGIYTVKLVGKKEFCLYEKSMQLPFLTFFVPNVITPDQSNGLNDTFQLLYGGKKPSEQGAKVQLVVYNRWGKIIYENKDYNNDWSGTGLAAGVYYFDATIPDEASCHGWVQIIR